MRWRHEIGRFLRFTALGAVGTVAHYAVLIGAVEAFELDPAVAACFGFLIGAGINYGLARRFVFQTARSHPAAFSRFLLVALAGLALTAVAMRVLVDLLGLNYLIAQVAITAGLVVWHYTVNRLWSFGR